MRAVEGFDPSMKIRFSTYATYWIKQSIKHGLVSSAKTIRVPAYMAELLTPGAEPRLNYKRKPAAALPRKK